MERNLFKSEPLLNKLTFFFLKVALFEEIRQNKFAYELKKNKFVFN
jgi:hypothetical protein